LVRPSARRKGTNCYKAGVKEGKTSIFPRGIECRIRKVHCEIDVGERG